jgi:hypothetical protein
MPVKFIFDEQKGVEADIALWFDSMKQHLPRAARKLISGTPQFENDKDYTPLQAADMLAWHLRREHEEGKPIDDNPLPGAELLRGGYHIVSHLPDIHLAEWAEHHSRQPGIEGLKSKPQWQRFRQQIASQQAAGFFPPPGSSRWRHFVFRLQMRVLRAIALRRLKARQPPDSRP